MTPRDEIFSVLSSAKLDHASGPGPLPVARRRHTVPLAVDELTPFFPHTSGASPPRTFRAGSGILACSVSCSCCTSGMAFSEAELVGRIIGATACVLMSAFFAGLTLGLMGLDTNELKLLIASGTAAEKAQASVILPIRKHGNLLLCTLVYGNVAATALASILLADLTDGVTGFIVSTFVLVIWGEIVPQTESLRPPARCMALATPRLTSSLAAALPLPSPPSTDLQPQRPVHWRQDSAHDLLRWRCAPARHLPHCAGAGLLPGRGGWHDL